VAAEVGVEGTPLNLAALERALLEEPSSFQFFQAIHLLERLRPERSPLGGFGDPDEEVVHIGVNPRLGFPASEIQSMEAAGEGRPRMTVNFTGLTGPSGVLPYPYSTLVLERLAARDGALAAFLDLFHHRVASLLHRAWEKHRFAQRHVRGGGDPLAHHLRDLAGLGLEGEEEVGSVRAERVAGYAGLLGMESRSAVGLEQLVVDYFDVPCRVEQFVGRWYPVAEADHCFLDEPSPASTLGEGALVGDEVWDPGGGVRVRLGPLSRERFDSFLPDGEAHQVLATLLRLYGHGQYEFEVQLVLARDEVSGVVLDGDGDAKRLGWTSWISTRDRESDADEAVLSV
jgi:type VI secretion system protein ImpH